MWRCIGSQRLIEQGEKVVVGVSGGPDSLCLLHCLNFLNQRHRQDWQLLPVHVDPGFAGWNAARVLKASNRIGVECVVIENKGHAGPATAGRDSCFWCARRRRKALFEAAGRWGAAKVALAHHMEDATETFLMNLLMTASGSTFLPKQELFGGKLAVVRPLYRLGKPDIRSYLRFFGIRPVRNPCRFRKNGMRLRVRRFLERLYAGNRRIRTNAFSGLHNLRPEYLPGPSNHSHGRAV